MKNLIIIEIVRNGEMMVTLSTHPKYTEGTRFDFGYMNICIAEGYMVIILPKPKPKKPRRFKSE